MRILAITPRYPSFDRAAGDFRLLQMLKMLAGKHRVTCSSYRVDSQVRALGEVESGRYRDALADAGVRIEDGDPLRVMRRDEFDLVLFEFYASAARYMDEARALQERAVKIVDTVDVAFNRMFKKACLTGSALDRKKASRERRAELRVYRGADHVIAVSAEDRAVLLAEDPGMSVGVVPTIHPRQPFDDGSSREPDSMLFVGNFRHDPNVDAVLYFCGEVLPLVWREIPTARLRIIGDPPPEDIRRLASDRIEVLGYVLDLGHYLRKSRISVAPLRYGGGMKGKVGEALAAGLPVVSTPNGIEGYELLPGRDVLVASSAREFSEAIVRLVRDPDTWESVRLAGWRSVSRFSVDVVAAGLLGFLEQAASVPPRPPSGWQSLQSALPAPLRHALASALARRYR